MDIKTIEFNFNRGQMNLEQIKWLIETMKELEEQANLMAEKAAEKEIAFGQFVEIIGKQKQEIALYKLQETKLLAQLELKDYELKNLKKSTRFRVYEENLALAQENALLKGGISG